MVRPAPELDTVFFDDTFADSNWTTTIYLSTDFAGEGAAQALAGGNPGEYRGMSHIMPGPSRLVVLHKRARYAYSPAQGAIITSEPFEPHDERLPRD